MAPSDAEGTSPRLSRSDPSGSGGWSDRLLAIEKENRELRKQVKELDSLQTVLQNRLETVECGLFRDHHLEIVEIGIDRGRAQATQ